MKNFKLFQIERVCIRLFKLDKNGRKFSKWTENTAGKGEIARYEQFLLFQQCFQKTFTADTYKPGLVWERVKRPFFIIGRKNGQTTSDGLDRSCIREWKQVFV